MMKTLIYFLLFAVVCNGCSSLKKEMVSEKTNDDSIRMEIKNRKQIEENKGKNAFVFGTIIQEEFVNKGGRSTGVMETLIKLEDGETFHLRNKGENKYDYNELLDKKVKLEAFIFYGNIDSDNPEHQSRVGYRIDYTSIIVID